MARKTFVLLTMVMSSSVFNRGFALSSHFDADGAPLSELSWSSSLAVVAISFSGLFTFVFLMLACLCCKKGNVGFKFENADGEEYQADMSMLASPSSQSGPEVYILPLTEVSLPVAQQPGRSVQLLKATDLGRHSLLYLKEIGDGWFGKVLLGEVHAGLSTTQVVVKELRTSTSLQDQMHFLEEAQPYRALQHPALLQCLAQCTEVTPYLLVMECCPLGDVKGYLRGCRAADAMTPEPLVLQRMACDIASGLLHLHKHNFTHSDLALRNCLLTTEITVKIGDYGISHNKYKDDYYVTSDQMYVPLRWIAPELIDEVHGNLLVADPTPPSNIWSLGVTIWELLELGNQPYRHYSDRQVLSYAVREQPLRLPKPLLKVPLAERWYEVMQFCWLQPDQRPNAEEVHLLLSYLCAKGASEAEEDFESRWNSLCPNAGHGAPLHGAPALAPDHPSSSSSSFPLLERFSSVDGYHSESGDDILTVTETSQGLNFEYKWEQARRSRESHYQASSASSGTLGGQANPHCQDMFYPPGGMVGGCPMEGLGLGMSPSYYTPKQLHGPPGVVPVLSAHSPSVGSEYYIRLEEPVECNMELDYTMCSYSPDYQGSNGSFLTGSGEWGDCMACPSQAKNVDSYWSSDVHKAGGYDSDTSPAISLTMEPLLGHVSDGSPLRPWESGHYVSYKDRDGGYYYEQSPPLGLDRHYLVGGEPPAPHQESWGSRSLRQALGELEHPLGISPSVGNPPPPGYGDPYLDTSQEAVIGKSVTGGYYDMMGSLRKTMPGHDRHLRPHQHHPPPGHASHSVSINMETEGVPFEGHGDSNSEEEDEEDIFVERHSCNTWPAKHHGSAPPGQRRASHSCRPDAYVDFHYTMPSTDIEDAWPDQHSLPFRPTAKPLDPPEPRLPVKDNSSCLSLVKQHPLVVSPGDCSAYIYLCHEGEAEVPVHSECCHSHFIDPLTGLTVRNYPQGVYGTDKVIKIPSNEEPVDLSPAPGGPTVSKPAFVKTEHPSAYRSAKYMDIATDPNPGTGHREEIVREAPVIRLEPKVEEVTLVTAKSTPPPSDNTHVMVSLAEPESERSHTADSGLDRAGSSGSLVDILDCSDDDGDDDDDDTTDVTSGIFADEAGELNASPAFKSLQKQVGTPDSMDSMELPSAEGSGESPATCHPSSSPRALDSGYDTENNESPEFVPKEPHEPRDPILDAGLEEEVEEEEEEEEEEEQGGNGVEAEVPSQDGESSLGEDAELASSQSCDEILVPLSDKDPYRDSAYFSDYENERLPRENGEEGVGGEEKTNHPQKDQNRKKEDEEEAHETMEGKKLEITTASIESTACPSAPLPSSLSTAPSGTEGILVGEGCQVEGLELAADPSGREDVPECSSSSAEAVLEEWSSQEESSSLGDWAAEVVGAMEEALGALSGEGRAGVPSLVKEGEPKGAGESTDSFAATEEEREGRGADPSRSAESVSDEAARKHVPLSRRRAASFSPPPPSTPPPPLPATEGRPPPADGEEADEEGGDTDDSEESDEELRSYSVREASGGEESDEECYPVPIVVSDCSDAHSLRSLLRRPTLLTAESIDDRLEGRKKVVSFFDDVTVYLFDQESPTKELSEHGFPPDTQGRSADGGKAPERVSASDDSSDGNVSEESAGYEWEDDFPLLPLPTSQMASEDSPPAHSAPSLAPEAPEPKPAVQYSRFTVSPSSVSRFSITHVTDSDVDSVGGSSEDGDKE
ncbi:serine/threonine-protein kinase LMTK1 [Aplochiton taeniatus]